MHPDAITLYVPGGGVTSIVKPSLLNPTNVPSARRAMKNAVPPVIAVNVPAGGFTSPPDNEPHVTIDPSVRMAAFANVEAAIAMNVPDGSGIPSGCPQLTTVPSVLNPKPCSNPA